MAEMEYPHRNTAMKKTAILGFVYTTPEKSENGDCTLKTHNMF